MAAELHLRVNSPAAVRSEKQIGQIQPILITVAVGNSCIGAAYFHLSVNAVKSVNPSELIYLDEDGADIRYIGGRTVKLTDSTASGGVFHLRVITSVQREQLSQVDRFLDCRLFLGNIYIYIYIYKELSASLPLFHIYGEEGEHRSHSIRSFSL